MAKTLINIALEEADYKRLEALAAESRSSLSGICRTAIRSLLDDIDEQGEKYESGRSIG